MRNQEMAGLHNFSADIMVDTQLSLITVIPPESAHFCSQETLYKKREIYHQALKKLKNSSDGLMPGALNKLCRYLEASHFLISNYRANYFIIIREGYYDTCSLHPPHHPTVEPQFS